MPSQQEQLRDRPKAFAVRIVRAYRTLPYKIVQPKKLELNFGGGARVDRMIHSFAANWRENAAAVAE